MVVLQLNHSGIITLVTQLLPMIGRYTPRLYNTTKGRPHPSVPSLPLAGSPTALISYPNHTFSKYNNLGLVTMGNTVQKPNQTSEDLKEEQQPQEAGEDVSSFTCEICIEPVSSNMRFGFNNTNSKCSHHSYCLECIQNYIQAKVEEYNLYEIKCPGLECNEFLDPLMCRTFLSEKVFVKWCDALCESTLLGYQKAYCPFQNCSTLILNECGGSIGNTKCPYCKNNFCFECKVPWHVGFTCNQTGQSDVLLHRLMEQKRWARCPACNHGVELNDGCNMVRCRCGTSFCYLCGKRSCRCNIVHEILQWITAILFLPFFPIIFLVACIYQLFRKKL